MEAVLEAVRSYFEERNRAWVSQDVTKLAEVTHARSQSKWWVETAAAYRRKQTEMLKRRYRLVRAHSRIAIRSLERTDALGRIATGVNEGNTAATRVIIDETIHWVYRNHEETQVESRLIRHQQWWVRHSAGWRLEKAHESGETGKPALPQQALPPVRSHPTGRNRWRACNAYDRLRALRYADLWWNGFHPSFPKFDDDCTNFISQTLFAGGMLMTDTKSRSTGWWYVFDSQPSDERWSYSWSTSHALYLYLTHHIGAQVTDDPRTLRIGDVIFYDWDGSGRFHHTTVVTDFDSNGDPLVNAHTTASYHRHYLYLDSPAWTQSTKYGFVQMPDTLC